MGVNIDLLPLLFILIGLGSIFYIFSDLFGLEDKTEPKSQKEKKERREERQNKLKEEYEEKQRLKKEKRENLKLEKENLKKSIKGQKKEVDFFSWLKPKTKTTKLSNGDVIIEDRVNEKKFVPPLFGSSGKSEEKSINDKLEDLVKEFRDL